MSSSQQASWTTARILWGALLSSIVVYVVVLETAEVTPDAELMTLLRPSLAGSALLTVIVSFVLPRQLFTQGLRRATFAIDEVPDPNASVMFRDHTPTIRVFADAAAAERKLLQLYFTPLVLGLALSESIAIYGLVLGLNGAGREDVLPFFAASALLIAIRFPRPAAVRARAEAVLDAKFPRD